MSSQICSECGRAVTEYHVHHLLYRSLGGDDSASNLAVLCVACHVNLHSSRGDFRSWGSKGGKAQAENLHFLFHLKQFNSPEKRALWVLHNAPHKISLYQDLESRHKPKKKRSKSRA